MARTSAIHPIRLLPPPYAVVRPVDMTPPPLGAILVCNVSGGGTTLRRAAAYHSAAPWLPLVLSISPVPLDLDLLQAFTHLRGQLAYLADSFSPIVAALTLSAVTRRPPPTSQVIADYVARRLTAPELAHLVSAALDEGAGIAYRTLCRRLAEWGPLSPRDWRVLRQLAVLPRQECHSVEELARACGVEARTLRTQVSRLIGVSPREYRTLVGWEWVFEAALRRHGYPLRQAGAWRRQYA